MYCVYDVIDIKFHKG